MQSLAPLAQADLLAPVQTMLYKLEVYDGSVWRDLSDLKTGMPRKKISIKTDNLDADLTDFPLCVIIKDDDDIGGVCRPDGYDVHFTASDGTTRLKFERVSFSVSGGKASGEFWVKCSPQQDGTHIYVYYGNPSATDESDPEAVWDSNFKAVYHMNDNPDTSHIKDSTANANNGTKKGAGEPVEAVGIVGKAQSFDGSNDYIVTADRFPSTNRLTMSMWLNPSVLDASYFRTIIHTGWNANGSYIVYVYDGRYYFQLKGDDGSAANVSYAASSTWEHWSVVINGSNVLVYKNGSHVATSGAFSAGITAPAVTEFGGAANRYAGLIDEFRVASVARSAAWLKFEYHNMADAGNCLTWGAQEIVGAEAGIDYLKSVSVSLGGAGLSPEPIAGTWTAVVHNDNGIFHPEHPSSPWKDLLRVGRRVKISVGGMYGGSPVYWQRLIGYMDAPRFDHSSRTVIIGGMDYMKHLTDTVLGNIHHINIDGTINGPLYWGRRAVFDSKATGGAGFDIYSESDACAEGSNEDGNVDNWSAPPDLGIVTCVGPSSEVEESDYLLRFIRENDYSTSADNEYCENSNIASLTAGQKYIISFWGRVLYAVPTSNGYARVQLMQSGSVVAELSFSGGIGKYYQLIFTAIETGDLAFRLYGGGRYVEVGDHFDIDNITVKTYDPETWTRYDLPPGSNGPYLVTLDGEPIGQGDQESDLGWHYDTQTASVYFSENMAVPNGVNNVHIYYYTDQDIVDVLCDVLVWARLYPDRATAKSDLNYTSPSTIIGRVWFDSDGMTALAAIAKICERLDYRFWFSPDGTPQFHPAPDIVSPEFSFTEPGHIKSVSEFQDATLLRNHVIIEGCQQAWFQVTRDDKSPDRWLGEASDPASIADYLEHTYQIANNLFQDQASVNAAASSILSRYKDPCWAAQIDLLANPVPLELGDTIEWETEVAPALTAVSPAGRVLISMTGVIRDIKLADNKAVYKVERAP